MIVYSYQTAIMGVYSYKMVTKMYSLLYVNYTSIESGEEVKKPEDLNTDMSVKWYNNYGK